MTNLRSGMARDEALVHSAESRAAAEEQTAAAESEKAGVLRGKAADKEQQAAAKSQYLEGLDSRFTQTVSHWLLFVVSMGYLLFDAGIIGTAFHLIPGPTGWKILLTAGVSLAPLSISIGIALWLSSSRHPVREVPGAGRLALLAAICAGVGLLLIILFRSAAAGDGPIAAGAFAFMAFLQVALGMAETMLYIAYFDSRRGVQIRAEIEALMEAGAGYLAEAEECDNRSRLALKEANRIRQEAAEAQARLNRESEFAEDLVSAEEGTAQILTSIVDFAILEGEAAARAPELAHIKDATRGDEIDSLMGMKVALTSLAVLCTGLLAVLVF